MKPFSRCVIVTPTFDAQAFLDDTIASVVLQSAPEVAIDYHIQDGGSTDGTEAIVRAWIARVEGGALPRLTRSLRLTWASARDRGMYDAINTGMAALAPGPEDMVTWINADDRLAPGAIETAHRVFTDVGCEWLSGRSAALNEAGSVMSIAPPQPFARAALAEGRHDGRALISLMQEGTFFTGRLWATVGGVDPGFRLAGDWDLWRRMAAAAAHVTVDTVTAFHRRRAGQLSADMAGYHAEVDARRAEGAPAPVAPAPTRLVRYDPETGTWIGAAFDPSATRPPIAIVKGDRRATCAVTYLEGFGPPEGPYPEARLPTGVRWLRETTVEIAVAAPGDGAYRLTLAVRPAAAKLWVRLFCNGEPLGEVALASPAPDTDQLVEMVAWLGVGRNVVELEIAGAAEGARLLLLVGCTAIAEPDGGLEAPREMPPPSGELVRALRETAVVVTTRGNPTRLAETIASVRDAAGGGLFVRVEPDTDAAGVIAALVPYARVVAPGGTPSDEQLRGEGFRAVLEIAEGEVLRPDACAEALRALRAGVSGVAGIVDVIDGTGLTVRRLLPDRSRPVLRGLDAGGGVAALPVTLLSRVGASGAEIADSGRRVVVIDRADERRPARPLFALAGALRMFGVDASYQGDGAAEAGALVIAAEGAAPGEADFTVAETPAGLTLTPRDRSAPILLPAALDTEAFRPRARAPARAALALAADGFLVLADVGQVEAARRALPRGAQLASFADAAAAGTIALPLPSDPDTIAHLIAAFDVVIADGAGWLALAASACGLSALDATGAPVGSGDAGPGLAPALRRMSRNRAGARLQAAEARARTLRSATIDALALALHDHADRLGIADRGWLSAGVIDVPSDAPLALEPPIPHHRGFALSPFRGVTVESDSDWGRVLRLSASEVVLLLRVETLAGTALRLHVAGPEGSAWAIQVDDAPAVPLNLLQSLTTARVPASLTPGLHRVTIRAVNAAAQAGLASTRIVAWEVVSTRATPGRPDERTRLHPLPHAGRQVERLARDGDWSARDGFLAAEEAHPAAGLHAPFRWTAGDHAGVLLRVDRGGVRTIDLAITAVAAGQRLRLVVGGVATGWSAPLPAYVGRVSHVRWEVDWSVGDIEVRLELTDRPTTGNPRDLGVIVLAITLS